MECSTLNIDVKLLKILKKRKTKVYSLLNLIKQKKQFS